MHLLEYIVGFILIAGFISIILLMFGFIAMRGTRPTVDHIDESCSNPGE